MPCPHFEPREPAETPTFHNGRFPLLREFEGICWVTGEPASIEAEARLSGCNQGNPHPACARLTPDPTTTLARLRFSVAERCSDSVVIMVIEELRFEPVQAQAVRFTPATGALDPELPVPARSQVLAFCRAYLNLYPLFES